MLAEIAILIAVWCGYPASSGEFLNFRNNQDVQKCRERLLACLPSGDRDLQQLKVCLQREEFK